MSEERYKMALEVIAKMYIPPSGDYRRDSIMSEIAKTALTKDEANET